jgi:hypothetical protein
MPNRLLREGICTSDLLNELAPEEEVFFYRLLVICDDFGHADARAQILKANCFPLKESATRAKIEQWIDSLAKAGLIRRYTAQGKLYLAIAKWEQRIRSHPKFPLPTDDGSQWVDSGSPQMAADCGQAAADSGLGKGKGKGKGATSRTSRELLPLPEGWVPKEQTIERVSREFGLVPEDVHRYVAAFRDVCKAKDYRYKDHDAAFANCVRQDWPRFRDGRAAQPAGKVAL